MQSTPTVQVIPVTTLVAGAGQSIPLAAQLDGGASEQHVRTLQPPVVHSPALLFGCERVGTRLSHTEKKTMSAYHPPPYLPSMGLLPPAIQSGKTFIIPRSPRDTG